MAAPASHAQPMAKADSVGMADVFDAFVRDTDADATNAVFTSCWP